MSKRFQNYSTFERDGIHIQIDRTAFVRDVAVYIWKDGYDGQGRQLMPDGSWQEIGEGVVFPQPSLRLPGDILLALQQALNDDEVPTAAASTLLADTLKNEQARVDKLLEHVLTKGKR